MKLAVATKRNASPGNGMPFKRKLKLADAPKYLARQQSRKKKRGERTRGVRIPTPNDEEGPIRPVPVTDEQDPFLRAFENINMTPEMEARAAASAEEARRIVEAERAEEREVARDATIRTSEAFNRFDPQRQVHRNYGDVSGISQERYGKSLGQAIDGRNTPTGHRLCAITGCHRYDLTPSHQCYRVGCNNFVHNLCVQDNDLSSTRNELNMFCSVACKRND